MPYCYGNSRAMWDNAVLLASRQWWYSCLYPGHLGWYSSLATPEGWQVCSCITLWNEFSNKKHLKNVGPIRHNEPPHAHSADVASGTVVHRLCIDVHDDNGTAWQRGLLWPYGMVPIKCIKSAGRFLALKPCLMNCHSCSLAVMWDGPHS